MYVLCFYTFLFVVSVRCFFFLLQGLDRQATFSYGLPLLPDAPRPPVAPPTLLSCLVKDTNYKVVFVHVNVYVCIFSVLDYIC